MTERPDMDQAVNSGLFVQMGERQVIVNEWSYGLTSELDGLPDGVSATMHMKMINGVPQCVALSFQSEDGLPAKTLRDFRLEDQIERACTVVALQYDPEKAQQDGWGWKPDFPDRTALPAVRKARAKARGGYTDEMLREVAEIYRAHRDHYPTKAVREVFDVAPSTAQLYVKKARERGFLEQFSAEKGETP